MCGVVASVLGPSAEVTLRVPPPLETPMRLERNGDEARLLAGDMLVAEARIATPDVDVPPPVSLAEAEAAVLKPAEHPYPGCFVCGIDREPGDGLRLWAGPVVGRPDVLAAPWTPESDRPELVWAALDCPGAWTSELVSGNDRRAAVLGRLTATIVDRPTAGEPCVVSAWLLEQHERKWLAGTAVHDANGSLKAVATSVWIIPRPR